MSPVSEWHLAFAVIVVWVPFFFVFGVGLRLLFHKQPVD